MGVLVPPLSALRRTPRRSQLVLLLGSGALLLLWGLLPPSHRPAAGYLLATAMTLVAARRLGLLAGILVGSVILVATIYGFPWLTGVRPEAMARDTDLVLLGLALVSLSAYMITPVSTDSSELRRRALFDLATDGILVWDEDGRFLEVNPSACEMLGYTKSEVLAMGVCDVVQPDERDRVRELRTRLQSGAAGTTEWRLLRRDGRLVHVDISAKRSPDGRWNAIVRDISERARAEAALRAQALQLQDVNARLEESRQRLRLAQELAQFGTFEWDVQADEYRWSSEVEALYGVPPGGLGRAWAPVAERIHPDDLPVALGAVKESMRKGLLDAEWRVVRPDGSTRWLASRGWMFRNENRAPVRLVAASFDVTEQKAVEEALQKSERELRDTADRLAEANRLKDEFLATLSHELRTPLQSVIGWSQMLMNGSLSAPSREKAVQAIHRNAIIQAQLIADLLDVSRIVSGKLRIVVETVDLVPVVEGALDTIRPAALNKNVSLQLETSAPALPLVGDADRLRQVIWNLLSNAVKFTPEGGRVDVRLGGDPSHVRVDVSDTGIGIEPEFLPFVFERFSQADGSTTKPHRGLGLGLAIARHLVHLHGGKITVQSAGQGGGATFTVTLPCRQAHLRAPAASALASRPESWGGAGAGPRQARDALAGIRILLVDDDEEARDTLRTALEMAGAVVDDADSTHEAIRALHEHWPDVLLSDIAMPGEDGYELIRRVGGLRSEHSERLRSVALTAFARESDRALALSAGFDEHLSKPVAVDVLIQAVQSVLERNAPDRAGGAR